MAIEAMFTLTEEFLVHSLSENVLESDLQTRPCYYLTKATRPFHQHSVDWEAMKKMLQVRFPLNWRPEMVITVRFGI